MSGHSMGGFGALNIAMRHPDIFAAVYALSPGLAAPGGLKIHPSFAAPNVRRQVLEILDGLKNRDACKAEVTLMALASYWSQVLDTYPQFALAYAAAFAPAKAGDSRILTYPYHQKGGEFIFDPEVWEPFERGFGDWDHKVALYHDRLKRLAYIAIDVGENDEHGWIPPGCRHVSGLFKARGIAHDLLVFPGGHEDRLRERLEDHLFPALSRILSDR